MKHKRLDGTVSSNTLIANYRKLRAEGLDHVTAFDVARNRLACALHHKRSKGNRKWTLYDRRVYRPLNSMINTALRKIHQPQDLGDIHGPNGPTRKLIGFINKFAVPFHHFIPKRYRLR